METVNSICQFLDEQFPRQLAAEWDNTGLLLGDRGLPVQRVMTCLTLTDDVAREAVDKSAELVISHHPLPFHPVKTITTDSIYGRVIWRLSRKGISVYSPHTAFDSGLTGINHQLATALQLVNIRPIEPAVESPEIGSGRIGETSSPVSLAELLQITKQGMGVRELRYVGELDRSVRRVAIACGSGSSFMGKAHWAGCDVLMTGEATFHACIEARTQGIGLILLGHFQSERFAVDNLATVIADRFPEITSWSSDVEVDPLSIFP